MKLLHVAPVLPSAGIERDLAFYRDQLSFKVNRGCKVQGKLRHHTPWGTHDFGLYDPDNNAIFFVEIA